MTDKNRASQAPSFWMALQARLFQSGAPGRWVALESHLPGRTPQIIGIILFDSRDEMHLRFKPEWWSHMADNETDSEIWKELAKDLEQWATDMGSQQILNWLSGASHTLRIGNPRSIHIQEDAETTLDFLYAKYIAAADKEMNQSVILSAPQSRFLLPPLRWRQWIKVAASAIVVWGLFKHYVRLDPVHQARQSTQVMGTSKLPFLDCITLADLSSWIEIPADYNRVHCHFRNAGIGIFPRTRRVLKISPITEPRTAERIHLLDPPISVSMATVPSKTLLPEPEPPELPRFRSRNPLRRVLAIIAAPFRLLASR